MEERKIHFTGKELTYELVTKTTPSEFEMTLYRRQNNNEFVDNCIFPASSVFEFMLDQILGTRLVEPENYTKYFGQNGLEQIYQDAVQINAELEMFVEVPHTVRKPELQSKEVSIKLKDININDWVSDVVAEKVKLDSELIL